jgi:hypothetical protein
MPSCEAYIHNENLIKQNAQIKKYSMENRLN